jgi:hypothetical protein
MADHMVGSWSEEYSIMLEQAGAASRRRLQRLRDAADTIPWRDSKECCEQAKAAHEFWAAAAEAFMANPKQFEHDVQAEERST